MARFRAPQSVQARLFFLMMCGLSTSVAATLPSCVTVLYPPVISLSFLLLTVSNWFVFGVFLHFACRFPADRDLLAHRKWPPFMIYLLPPAFALAASLLVGGISPAFWGWLQWLRNIFLPAIIIAAFGKLWWDYQHMQTSLEKKRFKSIVLSYWASFGPYLCLYLLPSILQAVKREVQLLASTDSAVLIQVESGTGKELVARAIRSASARSKGPFFRINCASIPAELLESELFGHCKSAFTGATGDRRGVFVQADGGVLFLDKIGDLPLRLQPKLLHAVEEKQITPVGETQPRAFSVKILSATNLPL